MIDSSNLDISKEIENVLKELNVSNELEALEKLKIYCDENGEFSTSDGMKFSSRGQAIIYAFNPGNGKEVIGEDEPMKNIKKTNCPFCMEKINVGAKKCIHCGEYLDKKLRKEDQANKEGLGSFIGRAIGWMFVLFVLYIVFIVTVLPGQY